MLSDSTNITILLDAVKKASRALVRDFGEISSLQLAHNKLADFVAKSYEKSLGILTRVLNEYKSAYEVISFETPIEKLENNKTYFLISPLSGIQNFERSIPFFAVGAAIVKFSNGSFDIIASAIEAPIMREIFVAEKGGGAWNDNHSGATVGKNRLRVSNRKINEASASFAGKVKLPKVKSLRLFSCPLLEICYVASGKLDLFLLAEQHFAHYLPALIILKEAGGRWKSDEEKIIVSNAEIFEKL